MKKIIKFINEAVVEFKKIEWPSRKQTLRLTGLVLGVSVIVSLYVSGLDYIFKKTIGFILR